VRLPSDPEIAERARRLEIPFNDRGVDPFGVSRAHVIANFTMLKFFYRHYFKVVCHGIENVPSHGSAMLIGNHAGGVALDATIIGAAMFFELEPPRLAQGMVEKFLNTVPFAATWMNRVGHFTGLPEHAIRMLQDGRMLMVFPEGAKGTAKLYKERYSLVAFGTGFMRLALQTNTPIVPVAFLGGGEAIPTIKNAYTLGKLIGAPYVPITPYLVALPLPVQLDIFFGEPMRFEGNGSEDDEVIGNYVAEVKSKVQSMLELGQKVRRGVP
jgi:1-acyl-sn-glycerol-3-phosphate acyltransferase